VRYPFWDADVAQLVEHQLPKLRVAGSNPVVRFTEARWNGGFLVFADGLPGREDGARGNPKGDSTRFLPNAEANTSLSTSWQWRDVSTRR
jgi:hypothetical protein